MERKASPPHLLLEDCAHSADASKQAGAVSRPQRARPPLSPRSPGAGWQSRGDGQGRAAEDPEQKRGAEGIQTQERKKKKQERTESVKWYQAPGRGQAEAPNTGWRLRYAEGWVLGGRRVGLGLSVCGGQELGEF
ncbi:hypothetical protein NDU88_004877 [Pleurodeles waltl]|uniref:Uncharacterized protein n=1 Tax=Pleurodeles waltl TaxID=8319 RepID=A0AAV7PM51_PLEWA|nr:hypothetical protein NDU88_004877 [Pleurodeles waltl]